MVGGKRSMPATVLVRFDASDGIPVTLQRLHAALGRVFDLPEGVSLERAQMSPSLAHRPPHQNSGVKPYSLGEMAVVGDDLNMEVRLLDDRLISTLDAWLAWGGVLTVGDGRRQTAHLVGLEAQIIHLSTWEELTQTPPAHSWELEFSSPTVFSARGQHIRGISPSSLAASLQQRWWSQSPETCPERPSRNQIDRQFDWDDDTYAVTINLSKGERDGRGRLGAREIEAYEGTMTVYAPERGEYAREFAQLMALAQFTNVGSYGSYGLGVMSVRSFDKNR